MELVLLSLGFRGFHGFASKVFGFVAIALGRLNSNEPLKPMNIWAAGGMNYYADPLKQILIEGPVISKNPEKALCMELGSLS